MTREQLEAAGRALVDNLRANGVPDRDVALFMTGYSLCSTMTGSEDIPPSDVVLEIATDMLKRLPTFAKPPPVQN